MRKPRKKCSHTISTHGHVAREEKEKKNNKTLLHHVAKEGGRCKTRSDTRLSREGRQGYKNAGNEISDGPTNRQPDRRTRKRPLVAQYL